MKLPRDLSATDLEKALRRRSAASLSGNSARTTA